MTAATKNKRKKQAVKSHPDSIHRERPFSPAQFWRNALIIIAGLIAAWGLWVLRQPVVALLSLVGDQEAVSAYLQSFGAWGPLVLALAQLIQVVAAVIPGHVFLVAAGYVYGFPVGFLLNITFVVAASQFAYSLARWAGRPFVNRFVPDDKLEHWYKISEKQGFVFFTLVFILPVFPTDVMNFVAGLSGISPRKFLAANFLGRLPSAIILTLIGSHGLQWTPQAWGLLFVFAVSVYITGRLVIRRIERQTQL